MAPSTSPSRRARARAAAALLATAVVLLSGCSSQPDSNGVVAMTGADAFKAADAAASTQQSVRIVSKGMQGDLPVVVDMRLSRAGGAAGTVSIGSDKIDVVASGSTLYLRADSAYWSARFDEQFAAGVGSRWVSVPRTSTTFASFANLTDYTTVTHGLLSRDSELTNAGEGTIAGQQAVQLVGASGSVWVTRSGTPLPVQVDDPSTGTVLRYGEWNSPVTVTPPDAAETVDLGALGIE